MAVIFDSYMVVEVKVSEFQMFCENWRIPSIGNQGELWLTSWRQLESC